MSQSNHYSRDQVTDGRSHPSSAYSRPAGSRRPRFLDRVRAAIRARHYSKKTEKAYVGWIRRFILFHGKRHPKEMGEREVTAFLSYLATREKVAASTQNQALAAILFVYKHVLGRELAWMENIVRAKLPVRLPVVFSRSEASSVLGRMRGAPWLMAALMYGSGLRVLEAARLRIKDVDFDRHEITVRDGKGRKDRVTLLPQKLLGPLEQQVRTANQLHDSRSDAWGGIRRAARRSQKKVSESGPRMGLAMGLSRHESTWKGKPVSEGATTCTNRSYKKQ